MSSAVVRRSPARRVGRRLVPFALALPLFAGGCENPELRSITPPLQDDSPLALAVGEALDERPEIARFSLSVKSLGDGTVRLSGRVDNAAQRHAAEQTAAAVDGVRSVINTIYLRE